MAKTGTWPEVESKVHWVGNWLPLMIGAVFFTVGVTGMVQVPRHFDAAQPLWIGEAFLGVFAFFGVIAFAVGLRRAVIPVYVRCAARGVLADVPIEPVMAEGSVVSGRLTHELIEIDTGWEWRPAKVARRFDRAFIWVFGVPMLVGFSAMLTGVLHEQYHIDSWITAAAIGMSATLICGGTAVVLLSLMMRAARCRQSRVMIGRDGGDVVLELGEESGVNAEDLAGMLGWIFSSGEERRTVSIARQRLVAVQLCPWKYVMQGSGEKEQTWAVQGLLVIRGEEEGTYVRQPILLTGNFAGGARLMRRLSQVLEVPYLFCADAAGWKAEVKRAKGRAPLRVGGIVT